MSDPSPNYEDGARQVSSMEFSDGNQTVTATKLVSMGELLLLECDGARLKLDAMLLEGLSWQQGPDDLAEFVPAADLILEDQSSSYENQLADAADTVSIANEYTTVTLGTLDTESTTALQIASDKGVSVLGPQTLCELTNIENTGELSRWFQTPIGPEQPL